MSRSVSIPLSLPLSSVTGSAPRFIRFKSRAAAITGSRWPIVTTRPDIISDTFIIKYTSRYVLLGFLTHREANIQFSATSFKSAGPTASAYSRTAVSASGSVFPLEPTSRIIEPVVRCWL